MNNDPKYQDFSLYFEQARHGLFMNFHKRVSITERPHDMDIDMTWTWTS